MICRLGDTACVEIIDVKPCKSKVLNSIEFRLGDSPVRCFANVPKSYAVGDKVSVKRIRNKFIYQGDKRNDL
jgi:hypothetical protein